MEWDLGEEWPDILYALLNPSKPDSVTGTILKHIGIWKMGPTGSEVQFLYRQCGSNPYSVFQYGKEFVFTTVYYS
jgi:hypothetical protein